MSENSKIEWTDHTFNPWWGCEKVSAGCKNCYAETLDNRYHHESPHWGPGSGRKGMSDKYWAQLAKWNSAAQKARTPAKVFCASMADVFEDHMQVGRWRERLFGWIEATPWLIWQLLTKRPENIMRLVPASWQEKFPANVWMGTSVENQAAAEERIRHLIDVPAAIRFLSCEPLIGPVDISSWFYPKDLVGMETSNYEETEFSTLQQSIHWVIAGGESGPHARPMHPDWVRSLRDQCKAAGVAFHFKQWGEWRRYDHWRGDNKKPLGMFQENIFTAGNIVWDHKRESVHMAKVGKAAAGRFLDGVTHNEFPTHNPQ